MTREPSTKLKATRASDNEVTLGDQIYQALRWSLIVGDLKPR